MFRVIVRSVRRFREWANYTPEVRKITHADRIKELKTDEFVSGEYLKGLIAASRKKADLQEIMKYLADKSKTANLSAREVAALKRKVVEKIDALDMKELLKHFRDKGTLHFADWLDIFL
ncbi:hypothetical protein P9204_04370 [Geobacillus stearothermophilus]|nr:hypothetical protein [Geobacillus stearothermophilus]